MGKLVASTVFTFLLLFLGGVGHGQTLSRVLVTTDTLQVYFRQNETVLDASFRDNGRHLQAFTARFAALLREPGSKVRSILVVSGASPEGPFTLNQHLSDARSRAVIRYLLEHRLVDSSLVEVESRGADWQGLRDCVAASSLPYREEALVLIDSPLWVSRGGRVVDGRKQRLMNLHGGRAWRELYALYFPSLRGTRVMIAWNIRQEELARPGRPTPVAPTSPVFSPLPVPSPAIQGPSPLPLPPAPPATVPRTGNSNPFRLAIKSNLLLDAIIVPNAGVEVAIYRGWTVSGSYAHVWWRNKGRNRWYRFEGFVAEIRYYLNREGRPFRGHHVGLHGQLLTGDVTINGRGYLAGRWATGGGISYGYALPMGRRFNLDLDIGAGFLGGDLHEYRPKDGHRVWQRTKPIRWVGPTRAGVSLQWLLGKDNFNERRHER